MIRVALLIVIVFYFNNVVAQLPEYKKTNYTVEDGLPSNECHRILQDKSGYIWIATDRGLVRFDGYDFKVYGLKEGLLNPSVLELIYVEAKNTLYMLSFGDKVYEMNLDTEEIKLFSCQKIINAYNSKYSVVEMHISQSGDFYFDLVGYGVLKINELCEGELLEVDIKDEKDKDNRHFGVIKIDSSVVIAYSKWFETLTHKPLNFKGYGTGNFEHALFYKSVKNIIPNSIKGLSSNYVAFQLNDSIILCSARGYDFFIKNRSVFKFNKEATLRDVIKLQNNGFVTVRADGGGVSYFENIEELLNQEKRYLNSNLSPTCVFEDESENIWITTLDNGIIKLSKNIFNKIAHSTNDQNISDVIFDNNKVIYIEEYQNVISAHNAKTSPLYLNQSRLLNRLYKIDDDNIFVSGSYSFIINKNDSIRFLKLNQRDKITPLGAKRIKVFNNRKFWVSNASFGYYTELNSQPQFELARDLNLNNYRVLDVQEVRENLFLLSRHDGLYYFKDSIPSKIISDRPELNMRVNYIAKKDGWYILATQGLGVVFWDLKDQFITVDSKDGLCTDNIEEIFVGSTYIYVLTKAGLSQLDGDPIEGFDVRCFTSKHGLPSNQINGIDEKNDTLVIATNKGLVFFDQKIEQQHSINPIVEYVEANGVSIKHDTSVHYTLNDIKYHFKTLDYDLFGDINYRYKLNDQEWNQTNATTVDFPDLNPGNYSFQVQSQNKDGKWGGSAIFDFSIKPAWWQRWIIRLIFLTSLGIIGYIIYQKRLREIAKDFEIEKEIRDLEKSALAAQMNPHFIFNCLNSIQNYVMKNEKEAAMEYLGKFALLIRGNLNASTESSITLYKEIEMLTNYLTLEQLRLNNAFEFDISFDKSIAPPEIKFPPMLIQPFVENAVIHGMKNTIDKGIIKVSFQKKQNQLHVTVYNSRSKKNKIEKSQGIHKSFGAKITQKRLALINKMSVEDVKVKPIDLDHGNEVRITIQIKDD